MNKYLYEIIIQGHYGYGWEDLAAWDARDELDARRELRLYNTEERDYAHRMIRRRSINTQYRERPF